MASVAGGKYFDRGYHNLVAGLLEGKRQDVLALVACPFIALFEYKCNALPPYNVMLDRSPNRFYPPSQKIMPCIFAGMCHPNTHDINDRDPYGYAFKPDEMIININVQLQRVDVRGTHSLTHLKPGPL
ncbi:hypothetical protein ACLOJK_003721 [Asimina triloba]